jgi:hypothetical protein
VVLGVLVVKLICIRQDSIQNMPLNESHSLIVSTHGEVYSWGRNDQGQLGCGDNVDKLIPTKVIAPVRFSSVSAGCYDFSIAISSDDGSVWSWGNNSRGTLGLGSTVVRLDRPTQIPHLKGFVSVVTGERFVLALDKNADVWCWGENSSCQLGIGDSTTRWVPTKNPHLHHIQMISAGCRHGLALGISISLFTAHISGAEEQFFLILCPFGIRFQIMMANCIVSEIIAMENLVLDLELTTDRFRNWFIMKNPFNILLQEQITICLLIRFLMCTALVIMVTASLA